MTLTPSFTDSNYHATTTVSVNTAGLLGTVTVNANGTLTYNPNGQFENLAACETATVTFTYTITDNYGDKSTATATVTIVGQNDAPVSKAITGSILENGSAITLAPSYTDADTSDTHSTSVNTSGTKGSVTVNSNGTISYNANGKFEYLAAGETATDTFTYTISDNHGGTSTATATVTIVGANDAPVTSAITGSIAENGSAITLTPSYTDADTHDTHTTTVNTANTKGTVTVNSNGTISYNANGKFEYLAQGETATDTFTYTIADNHGGVSTATATVTIVGVNDAPVASAVTGSVQEHGGAITLTPSYTDADTHDTHYTTVNASGTKGTVTVNSDGSISYNPNGKFASLSAGETATDTFTYTITDNHGGASTATATVTIVGQNDAVVTSAIGTSVQEHSGAVTLTPAYTDADAHDTHTTTVSTANTKGTVAVNSDGSISYNANGKFAYLSAGEMATDTFTYTVTDNHGSASTATATVTIIGQNDAPVATAITSSIAEKGAAITLTPSYTDPDLHDTHTTTVNTSGTKGTVAVNSDGSISYNANGKFNYLSAGETATDTFTYTVSDNHGGASTATATVTIVGANDAVIASSITTSVQEHSGVVTLTPSYTDADLHDTHTTTVGTANTKGTVTVNSDGSISYNPNGKFASLAVGETATDTFTYTITDNHGSASTATATVTIIGQNDAPVTATLTGSVSESGGNAAINLTPSYTDADTHDTHSVTIGTSGTKGSVSINSDGTLHYSANGQFEYLRTGQTATDTFTYTVADNHGGSSTATVTVTVVGQDDAQAPTLTTHDASGNANSTVALSLSSALSSSDPTGHLTINVSGLPTGATLNHGTHNSDGSWTLTSDQLTGLTVTPPSNYTGTMHLSVVATDAATLDTSTATTSGTVNVTFNAVATPPVLTIGGTSFSDNFQTENGGQGLLNDNNLTNWNVTTGTVDLQGQGLYNFPGTSQLYIDLAGSTNQYGALTSKQAFAPGT